jgi:hypothetical protein
MSLIEGERYNGGEARGRMKLRRVSCTMEL